MNNSSNKLHQKVSIFLMSIILFLSCQSQKSGIPTLKLKPFKVLDQSENDEIYFKPPAQLVFDSKSDRLFYTDIFNNRFLIFDSQLNYIREFGQIGQAPSEFYRPYGIQPTSNNQFIVIDGGNKRLQIFDSDFNFMKMISNVKSDLYGSNLAVNSKNEFIFNNGHENKLFSVYTDRWEFIRAFGNNVSPPSKLETNEFVKTFFNTVYFDLKNDELYCTFKEIPLIRKYDNNDSLVYEIDLNIFPEIQITKQITEENRRKQTNLNSYTYNNFTWDISCDEQYFYVLFRGENKDPVYVFDKSSGECIKKFVFEYKNEPCDLERIDCSSPDYIYAVESGGQRLFMFKKKEVTNS